MRSGHVKIARKAFTTDRLWLEERAFSKWEAWVDMIQLAQWAPRDLVSTKFGTIHLERGEFVLSIRQMAKRWGWSVQSARTFSESTTFTSRLATQRVTPAGTVYLIVNYDEYQSTASDNNTGDNTAINTGLTQDPHSSNTRTSSKAVRTKRLAADAAPQAGWVSRIAQFWESNVGRVKPGQVGATAKASHDQHGADALMRGVMLYVRTQKAKGKTCKWDWFVSEITVWIERAALPQNQLTVSDDGEMTPALEEATRA